MLKPEGMIQRTTETVEKKTLPQEFGLLCWNVHKENDQIRFEKHFELLLQQHKIDLIALQEVKINVSKRSIFDKFHLSLAPNIKFFNNMYGVLIGSYIPEISTFPLLSMHKESFIQTHKSAIFSSYLLHNGKILLLVNLHAINFRRTKIYNKEIELITETVRHHDGPLIIAGDFNSWNRKRIETLKSFTRLLNLHSITMNHGHLVKSFMRHKLDHIFYRGLKLQESHVIDTAQYSDHNALYVCFTSDTKN